MTAPRPETIEKRIKAALAAGLRVVEIAPDGTIRLAERGETPKSANPGKAPREW